MMKYFIASLFLLLSSLAFGQQTDAELTTQSDVIRNETASGGNTKTRIADMFQALIDNKINERVVFNTQTTDYTFALTDRDNKIVLINSASARVVTIPPNSSVAFALGTQITVGRLGSGTVTFAAGAGVTIRSAGAALGIRAQYSAATTIQIAADEWLLIGDIE